MTENALGAFTYSFGQSYYDNFKDNRIKELKNIGSFNAMYLDLWDKYDSTTTIDGIVVNNGVDIKDFVRKVYNGSQVDCMFEGIAHDIADTLQQYLPGGLGCTLGRIFRSVGDALGSFICTATVDTLGTSCGQQLLKKLKHYRDTEVMTDKEGLDMVRYYCIIGPRIVEAIDNDVEKLTMTTYIWNKYISKLSGLIDAGDKDNIVYVYFMLMDEMVTHYNIDTTVRFDEWLEEYKGKQADGM
jgi:hypothetical protein